MVTETTDAAAGTGTAYSLGGGGTFNGRYGTALDTDWIRVSLLAGTSYDITLTGTGEADPYLFLYDAAGTVVDQNDDDGATLNSRLQITPATDGTYYLGVSQYDITWGNPGETGSYVLTLASLGTRPVWTADEMAWQLTDGYWTAGQGRHAFDATAGGAAITVNLSRLTPAMRMLAERALAAWTETTGLRFAEVTGAADIAFSPDSTVPGAEASGNTVTDTSGTILSATVTIDQEWLDSQGSSLTSYSYQTYIHEIGHALGLGHAGPYDGNAVYGRDNLAVNDSWQLTLMSYFDQSENSYVSDSFAYAVTPMPADILAIADLYGSVATLRSGNTTYGENSTAGQTYALFSATNGDPAATATLAMTIVDQGGADTLDFRGDTASQRLDLRPGATSDVYGDTGTLVIAQGTLIETVLAGRGHDRITGNAAANWIAPGAGNDTVEGGDGADMVSYVEATARGVIDLAAGRAVFGAETDLLRSIENVTGTVFADLITGSAAANRIRALGDYDWLVGSGGGDTFEGGTGRDTVAYSAAAAGITASLTTGRGTAGQALGDSYAEVENLTGSSHGDRLTGNDDRNILRGLGGDDFLFGLAGTDTIDGGAGRDNLDGGLGNDRLTGGAGHDTLAGGAGWDTAVYAAARAAYAVTWLAGGAVSVLHRAGGAGGAEGTDRLTGIEVLEFSDGRLFL